MATHSSILAWRFPGTEEPGGLPPMGSDRVGHDWSDLAAAAVTHTFNYLINKVTILSMPNQKTSLSFWNVFSPSFFLSSQEPCPPKWLMVYSVVCLSLLLIPISLSWTLIIFNIPIVITLWSFLISSSLSLNSHQNTSQTLHFL